MASVLSLVGVVLQVLGAGIAAYGLVKTWDEFADKRVRDLIAERARRVAGPIVGFVQRLMGRRPNKIVLAGLADGVGFSDRLSAVVTWGPLPANTKAALAEVDRRTRLLSTSLANATERLDDEIEAVRKDLQSANDRLDEAVRGLEVLTRRVAIGGVKYEALGLFLIILGLGLQGIAGVMASG